MTETTETPTGREKPEVSRRRLTAGAAWAVPAIAVAGATPAYAASIVKFPGINGWVLNSPTWRDNQCRWYLEVDSTLPGTGPDGAPYGMYIYDVDPGSTFSNASLTYWIIGEQREGATWENLAGHSSCWSGPVKGAPQQKPDGLDYTPYTWTYTCTISEDDYQVDPIDGVERLYLGDFHVRAAFRQPSAQWPRPSLCNNVTYWTQRKITINTPGAGTNNYCFERRNGTEGAIGYQSC